MSAPLKPWERAGVNSRAFTGEIVNSLPTVMGNGGGVPASTGGSMPVSSGANAPPLPPRPAGTSAQNVPITMNGSYLPYRSGYSSYSSPYSYGNYGIGSYGGYGGYGGYSGYDPYSYYGRGQGVEQENGFIAAAEESSRQAFQSLESIVRAFGSISMMLDSTLNAVYSSFRAVLGMADQFSRLKSHFSRVFSALAIFRTAKWALHKLLYMLGLKKGNPANLAWDQAVMSTGILTESDIKKPKSSWPIGLFLTIIISAPYLIWKIISSLESKNGSEDKSWAVGEGEHFIAQADYDFTAANERELSFRTGQSLRLAPRTLQPRIKGWLLAATDGSHIGLVPANYVRILNKCNPAATSLKTT